MIEVRHLCKSFGNVTPLRDVNATVERGEVISIIGPSGTGKSTFLRCLNLLERPTGGEIYIDGENVLKKGVDVNRLRRKMGMVFQSFNLFSHLMVIENVMMGPEKLLKTPRAQAYEEGMRLLQMVGLGEKAMSYPDELSGGQRQRVAIARTLAMKPEIVLFDEPTSALDPTMVGEVLAVIRKLAVQGLTMMIVTHEMNFAKDVSSRVFYMDEGEIYESGTPREIFVSPRREKTRTFILRLSTFDFAIRSRAFDFFRLNSELEEWGGKLGLSKRKVSNLQLVTEEVVVNLLLGHTCEIDLHVAYSKDRDEIEFTVLYGGEAWDPMSALTEENELSERIIKKLAENYQYAVRDDKNCLELLLKGGRK